MIIDGILGSEAIDSSGELIDLRGCDISDAAAGTMLCNYEHLPGEQGASTIVGVVTEAKKIYKESDCDNDREKMYWNQVKKPILYGKIRLYDGAGHDEAKRLAAIIRDHAANNEKIVVRYSVEGSTLKREGNRLLASVIRRIALTTKPCNRSAVSGLLEDPNAPDGFKKDHSKKKDLLDLESAQKSEDPLFTKLGGSVDVECDPEIPLEKTLTAGSATAAPSALVGGSALQSSDKSMRMIALGALRDSDKYLTKEELKAFIKHRLPEASEEFLDHFVDAADSIKVKHGLVKHTPEVPSKSTPEVGFMAKVVQLDQLDIALRKATSDLESKPASTKPSVDNVHVKIGDDFHPAGRYMIQNGNLSHLEDHHGILAATLPEGPVDHKTLSAIHHLSQSPRLKIENDEHMAPTATPKTPTPQLPSAPPMPKRDSVFHYTRVGHDRPHTLEVTNGHYLLDGKKLSYPEVETIVGNIKSGAGTIRYKKSAAAEHIKKFEEMFENLSKGEEPEVDDKHISTDPMTGLGNKHAYGKHKAESEGKPGVHVRANVNSLGLINEAHGYGIGDQTVATLGKLGKEAAEEVAPGVHHAHRVEGDVFHFHLPSHEHSARFLRALSQKMDRILPISGVHKVGMSFGVGLNAKDAEIACDKAKEAKKDHKPGKAPSSYHSLVPGKEGSKKEPDENNAALHAVSRLPEKKSGDAAKAATPSK
jgi:GGDEF domain-containing protein